MPSTYVRPSLLQEKSDGKIRCNICERRCLIVPGGKGWCRTRENRNGELVTLIYGALSSIAANPIEKKPFYHFYPGTYALTCGSWSCNFGCPWCQNWHISKANPPETGEFIAPERFIELVGEHFCQGTSISFNEPTLSLEWSLEVFRLAHKRGLYNTYVTNGYMTIEALNLLIDSGLDAMNVDIKGNAKAVKQYCKGVDVEKVWEICKVAYSRNVHLELTTLVIPTVNDNPDTLKNIAERINHELGPEVPWHVTAYRPAYRFTAPPTPLSTLEMAWRIGKQVGLKYVYTGNIPDQQHNHTYCPSCSTLLIQRMGFDILQNRVHQGRCPQCGTAIEGVWT